MAGEVLFDETFLKKLEYLFIVSKKIFQGRLRAERRSRKVGAGIEFADHRDYTPGDDLRYLDWNLFGRMDRLQLRLFEEQEDLYVYLLVDASASMGLGEPQKLTYAKKVAAALAYIGLSNLDRVAIVPFSEGLRSRLAPSRGKGQIFKVFEFLGALGHAGVTDLAGSMESFVHQNKRRGLAVVVSDFYDHKGYADGLNYLRFNKFHPFVVHLFDERELRPNLRGDLSLIDCETGEVREVTVSPRILEAYRQAHAAWCQELEDFCKKRQMAYFRTPVQTPFEDLILRIFRAGGFLK
jgi:uncharacterized protein (DUF58 family)